jgi:DNA-binding NarL/FixJ family response regulator
VRNSDSPIRVVVAEDSCLVREFLMSTFQASPEVELLAICSTREELEAAVEAHRPDVVVTDVRMPPSGEEEGIRVAARLRDTAPGVGVVVLSQDSEPDQAVAILESGAGGRAYLLKERMQNRDELIAAIIAVAQGGSVIDPTVIDVLVNARARPPNSPMAHLTPRERELLGEIATGKSNAAIATSLVLSKRAIEKHINSIFAKLGLGDDQDISRRVAATLIYLSDQGQR